MSKSNQDQAGTLRQQVEDLATQIILEGSDLKQAASPSEPGAAELLQSLSVNLSAITKSAQAVHANEAAAIAETLRLAVQEAEDLGGLADELSRGICNLQQAVEHTSSAPPPAPAKSVNLLAQDAELLRDFIIESREHLSSIEACLLKLEADPNDTEKIHTAFRGFHTIKGLAGFLELEQIRDLSHEVETILDHARNGSLTITRRVVDVVLASSDFLQTALNAIDVNMDGGSEEITRPDELIEQVRGLMAEPPAKAEPAPVLAEYQQGLPAGNPKPAAKEATPAVSVAPAASVEPAVAVADEGPCTEKPKTMAAKPAAEHAQKFVIRVDTAKLDHMLEMVGELVIAQSMVRHDPTLTQLANPRIQSHLAQLARITEEVQKTTMTLRMLPVGNLFEKVKRLVRDLSQKSGKQAELVIAGEGTEIDKTVIDGLGDPLMHMVRNALDHGIESPDERKAAGKTPIAKVALKAYHQAGHMVIEISDDGRGLSREKILRKAREKGMISENATPSDAEVHHLIFEPGFSTAEKVTDISGRGVGMDVVKKNILKMRGRVEITTEPGKGTTFYIKLPLTLAIIDGLVVGVGKERYIVPIFTVTEMFRPKPEMLSTVQGKNEMVMVRGRLLPFVRLHQRFGVVPKTTDPCASLFIVAECEGRRYCLMVDEFIGKQEVVIKSLGECLKNTSGIAGGAILGDGRVGLILEMSEVFRDRELKLAGVE